MGSLGARQSEWQPKLHLEPGFCRILVVLQWWFFNGMAVQMEVKARCRASAALGILLVGGVLAKKRQGNASKGKSRMLQWKVEPGPLGNGTGQ